MRVGTIKLFDIKSEDPEDHWSYLRVNNKRVLDLGCGRWETADFNRTTPIYFLSKGAKFVVGVDINQDEIDFFKDKNIDKTDFIQLNVNNIKTLTDLINLYNIQTIKMDIEGHERIILDGLAEDFKSIENIAIEYHIGADVDSIKNKLEEFGFTITHVGKLWVENMGVIFSEK